MVLSTRFQDAFGYALDLHCRQRRKGTEIPYIAHLMSVFALVLEHGGSEVEAIAALLHDAAEDQGGENTLEQIHSRFGSAVAGIVRACSDSLTTPKPSWKERKQGYIDHLCRTGNASVRLVSAADKLHNARAVLADYREHGEKVWDRFSAGKQDQLWYYREMAKTLTRVGPRPLAGELDAVVSELEELVQQQE